MVNRLWSGFEHDPSLMASPKMDEGLPGHFAHDVVTLLTDLVLPFVLETWWNAKTALCVYLHDDRRGLRVSGFAGPRRPGCRLR